MRSAALTLGLLAIALALLLPSCARANPALPKVRLHLRVEPGPGPPTAPPRATFLVELAWSFDPRGLRRPAFVRDRLDAWDPSVHLSDPSELPWLAAEQTLLEDPGVAP